MRYRTVVLALALLALSAGVAAGFSQLSRQAGCVSEDGSDGNGGQCRDEKALNDPYDIALSPDGRFLYSAAFQSDAVGVFARNTDGKLIQLALQNGCVSETGTGGECADGYGLDGANGLTLSPDGKNVYSAQWDGGSVAAFSRDETTGVLTEINCVSETGSGGACADGNTLANSYPITVSPDGEDVYVASNGAGGFFTPNDDGIALFTKDPGTGAITQRPGVEGCISETGSGCAVDGYGFGDPYKFAWSPDGVYLYLTNYSADSVLVFQRNDTTGLLTEVSCVSDSGADGCTDANGLNGSTGLAVSADGAFVYVAAATSIAAFSRNPETGALTQLPGTAGCIAHGTTVAGCAPGRALLGVVGLMFAKRDAGLYATSQNSSAVALFNRTKTGALRQLRGKAGCISQDGTDNLGGVCAQGRALHGAWGIVATANGKFVYISAWNSDAISVFRK